MKSISQNITAAAAAIITLITSATESRAADITLDGAGSYEFGNAVKFFPGGARQSGRYGNLGGDYYRKTTISMTFITNRSSFSSGNLSFEFWGMPYYGATKGLVLMTHSLSPLGGGRYYRNKAVKNWGIFLDEFRFPELNVWEYSRKKWKFRDALSFKRDNLL